MRRLFSGHMHRAAVRMLAVAMGIALAACQTTQTSSPRPPGLASLENDGALGDIARAQSVGNDVQRGDSALATGDLASARKAFSAAMRTSPSDPRPVIGLAETFLALGDLDKADELLRLVAEASDGSANPRVLQGRGLVALKQGRIDDAVRLLRDSVAADPRLWRAWLGLGQTWVRKGNYTAARAAFVKAEAFGSDKAAINNDIGMARLAENAPDDAIRYFERALAHEPGHEIARGNIRIARAMKGDYDSAISGAGPETAADVMNNVGYIAILNGDYEIADTLLRRALQISPVYHTAAVANLDLLKQTVRDAPRAGLATGGSSGTTATPPQTAQIALQPATPEPSGAAITRDPPPAGQPHVGQSPVSEQQGAAASAGERQSTDGRATDTAPEQAGIEDRPPATPAAAKAPASGRQALASVAASPNSAGLARSDADPALPGKAKREH